MKTDGDIDDITLSRERLVVDMNDLLDQITNNINFVNELRPIELEEIYDQDESGRHYD